MLTKVEDLEWKPAVNLLRTTCGISVYRPRRIRRGSIVCLVLEAMTFLKFSMVRLLNPALVGKKKLYIILLTSCINLLLVIGLNNNE